MKGQLSTDEMTKILRAKDAINADQKVVLQGFRAGYQLSPLIILTGRNSFQILVAGTNLFLDKFREVQSIASTQNVQSCLVNAHPESIAVRIKKRNHKHAKMTEVQNTIEVQQGLERANEDMMNKIYEGLKPYIEIGYDIFFEIIGHSFGGAIASQMAYHMRQHLAKSYETLQDHIQIQVFTFAAAGYFAEDELDNVAQITDAQNTMVHFYRKDDIARHCTSLAGYNNPGNWVFLDTFLATEGSLMEFLSNVPECHTGHLTSNKQVKKDLQNDALRTYVAIIKKAIAKDKNLDDERNDLIGSDHDKGSLFTPEVVVTIQVAAATVFVAVIFYFAFKRD